MIFSPSPSANLLKIWRAHRMEAHAIPSKRAWPEGHLLDFIWMSLPAIPCWIRWEQVRGRDWLAFANLDSMPFAAISKEQQFAEKLHAYTLPRANRPNTRVRDLVDMFLLVRIGMDASRVSEAIHAIFDRRKTHPIPVVMPPPPEEWAIPFVSLAKECGVVLEMDEVFKTVAQFVSE